MKTHENLYSDYFEQELKNYSKKELENDILLYGKACFESQSAELKALNNEMAEALEMIKDRFLKVLSSQSVRDADETIGFVDALLTKHNTLNGK